MNWYQQLAPTVKSVKSNIDSVITDIKNIRGVKDVYIFGSYKNNINKPDVRINDVDIIAHTEFDSGDLLAIDNGRDSPLKIKPTDLEDLGFNPEAVIFTRRFLSFDPYKVDPWVITADDKLLHWGNAPDTLDDWHDVREYADQNTIKETGLSREEMYKKAETITENWFKTYNANYNKKVKNQKGMGWYLTDTNSSDLLPNCLKCD